jgi:hypothetical protein
LEIGLRQQKNLYHLAIDMSPKEIDVKANQRRSGKISAMLTGGLKDDQQSHPLSDKPAKYYLFI